MLLLGVLYADLSNLGLFCERGKLRNQWNERTYGVVSFDDTFFARKKEKLGLVRCLAIN